MFKGMKKIISVAMAAAMAVTTIAPSASITVNAANNTLKTITNNTKSSDFSKINAKDMNEISGELQSANVNVNGNLSNPASSEIKAWAKAEFEKDNNDNPALKSGFIGGTLKTGKKYRVRWKNLTLDGSGKKYDLIVEATAPNHPIDTSKDENAKGNKYIVFYEKVLGALRYCGYKYLRVTYTIVDAGQETLANGWKGFMSFMDIDSGQGVEIETRDLVKAAKIGEKVGFTMPTDRIPGSHKQANIAYCSDANDASDGKDSKKYRLTTKVEFENGNNTMQILYCTGGGSYHQDEWQDNGVYMAFNGDWSKNFEDTTPQFSLTKTVNDKTEVTLSKITDAFTYKLTTGEIGNAVGDKMSKFAFFDLMDPCLEIVGTPTVTLKNNNGTGSKNVTSWFKYETSTTSGGKKQIKMALQKSHLNDEDMAGTFICSWNARLKSDSSHLSKHTASDGKITVPNGGSSDNRAFLRTRKSGAKADTDTYSNVVNVKAAMEAELSIDKVVDKYEHKVGDDVKFTLTVNETGKKTAANNVVVTDTIPSEYKVLKETQKGVEFMCREMEQIYSNQ